MRKNIRLLEDRVMRAAKRLREVSDERNRLQQRVASLQDELEELRGAVPVASDGEPLDSSEREDVVATLRETVTALRAR
jgi:predicted  nucleic acid-binding Zn-ribbon protein